MIKEVLEDAQNTAGAAGVGVLDNIIKTDGGNTIAATEGATDAIIETGRNEAANAVVDGHGYHS